jgi:hypothetical protein
MVASTSPRYWVGTVNEAVVPAAFDSTGVSDVITSIVQGSPGENRAWSVALTPYRRSPVSRVSALAVRVSWLSVTV